LVPGSNKNPNPSKNPTQTRWETMVQIHSSVASVLKLLMVVINQGIIREMKFPFWWPVVYLCKSVLAFRRNVDVYVN
jgi:hypothetical protein